MTAMPARPCPTPARHRAPIAILMYLEIVLNALRKAEWKAVCLTERMLHTLQRVFIDKYRLARNLD